MKPDFLKKTTWLALEEYDDIQDALIIAGRRMRLGDEAQLAFWSAALDRYEYDVREFFKISEAEQLSSLWPILSSNHFSDRLLAFKTLLTLKGSAIEQAALAKNSDLPIVDFSKSVPDLSDKEPPCPFCNSIKGDKHPSRGDERFHVDCHKSWRNFVSTVSSILEEYMISIHKDERQSEDLNHDYPDSYLDSVFR
jgi:hypothetical protein